MNRPHYLLFCPLLFPLTMHLKDCLEMNTCRSALYFFKKKSSMALLWMYHDLNLLIGGHFHQVFYLYYSDDCTEHPWHRVNIIHVSFYVHHPLLILRTNLAGGHRFHLEFLGDAIQTFPLCRLYFSTSCSYFHLSLYFLLGHLLSFSSSLSCLLSPSIKIFLCGCFRICKFIFIPKTFYRWL